MLDIVDELRIFVMDLDTHGIDYALCGGMAMGVHGFMRMTVDIDLLIPSSEIDAVIAIAQDRGYTIRGKDLSFKDGAIEIRRISKIDQETGDILPLDFLLVTPAMQNVWDSRIQVEWEGGRLSVVTRDGLITMKQLRGSSQDLVDIERLEEDENA